jgi:hypothetical protein
MVMLLRDSEPNGILIITVCVVSFATIMLLRESEPNGIVLIHFYVVNICHGNAVKGL